jgi:hypothetical protein
VPFADWRGHGFAALDPIAPLAEVFAEIDVRLPWLEVERWRADPSRAPDPVEMEDEAAVLGVQRGVRQFHRLLAQAMDGGSDRRDSRAHRPLI